MEFSSPEYWSWVAFLISRGSSQPRNRSQVSRTVGGFFIPDEPPRKSRKGVTKLSNQCSNLGGNCCHTSPLHILPESPLLLIFGFMSKRILRQKRLHSAVSGASRNRSKQAPNCCTFLTTAPRSTRHKNTGSLARFHFYTQKSAFLNRSRYRKGSIGEMTETSICLPICSSLFVEPRK